MKSITVYYNLPKMFSVHLMFSERSVDMHLCYHVKSSLNIFDLSGCFVKFSSGQIFMKIQPVISSCFMGTAGCTNKSANTC
jgi:hypothetical protein